MTIPGSQEREDNRIYGETEKHRQVYLALPGVVLNAAWLDHRRLDRGHDDRGDAGSGREIFFQKSHGLVGLSQLLPRGHFGVPGPSVHGITEQAHSN